MRDSIQQTYGNGANFATNGFSRKHYGAVAGGG